MKARARTVDLALLGLGLVALLAVPHRIGADGAQRFEMLERLFSTGHLESARYSVIGPLGASPLYLLGRAAGRARELTALYNPLLFVVFLALLARELRGVASPRTARGVLLLLVFASMFPNHVQVFYGEVFTSVLVTLGVFWIARGRALAGWTAIVAGAVNTPATILGVCAIALRDAWQKRRLTPLAGPLAVFILSRLESLVLRGSLFATGYEGDAGFHTALPYSGLPGFSYPFFLGLLAIFLSFGKGLVFFTPGLFVRQREPRLAWIHGTLVAFVAGLVLVYARWWAWYGGSFWGPRFFLEASVPAAMALAARLDPDPDAPLGARAAVLGALLLSFWVGVNGLVFDQTGLGICSRDHYALESFCWFVPETSVLWHPFVDFASSVPARTRGLALGVCAFWALAFAWISRDVLRDVFRGSARAARSIVRTLSLRDNR